MNIIHLNAERGSYLGTVHFYRFPDGSVSAMITEMVEWEIEKEPTIKERFVKFAGWLREGADSLIEQSTEFEETTS